MEELRSIIKRSETPAHAVCCYSKLTSELLKLFIAEYPGLLHEPNKYGTLPLELLLANPVLNADMLRLVINENLDELRTGCSYLHSLCSNASMNQEMLEMILDKNLFVKNSRGSTPLHYICTNMKLTPAVVRILMTCNLMVPGWNENTPLHDLCRNPTLTQEMLDIITTYYPLFRDIDDKGNNGLYCKNEEGITPAHRLIHAYQTNLAANDFDEEMIKFLVFPFKTERYILPSLYCNIKKFRVQQTSLKPDNFKFLESCVKKSISILIMLGKRGNCRLPKPIIAMIISYLF